MKKTQMNYLRELMCFDLLLWLEKMSLLKGHIRTPCIIFVISCKYKIISKVLLKTIWLEISVSICTISHYQYSNRKSKVFSKFERFQINLQLL